MNEKINTQVVVLGSGPSGYSAAFRCADLGLKTIIIERYENIGGVCLNVGCIPSKCLLHIVKVIDEIKFLKSQGILNNDINLDIKKIRNWKNKIISKLILGLKNLAKHRNIKIIHGIGKFIDNKNILVNNEININFNYAIIAAGSHSVSLPILNNITDSRIWNSTDALKLKNIPKKLLIIGGGIIGLEMATVYNTFGSQVDIIEPNKQLLPMVDSDIMDLYFNMVKNKFNIMLETKIKNIEIKKFDLEVNMKLKNQVSQSNVYDNILIAIGRKPNTKSLNLENIGVKLDKNNYIKVNKQMQTNILNIFAIGDIVDNPMLAHKGVHQGHIAAEVISGKKHFFDPKVIPSIAYTNPEIAWIGITEKEAKKNNINYQISIFPWSASGRAISAGYDNGMTKLIFNKNTNRIIGGEIIGVSGGELLGEIGLAIEMGCYAEDIALTIHAHPTLYESIGLSAEIFSGNITDLLNLKCNN